MLVGDGHGSTDPRNWAGSSGATYFLGATLAGALLLRALLTRAGFKPALLAVSAPALGLAAWFAQNNAHGLVVVEGFVLGALLALITEPRRHSREAAAASSASSSAPTPRAAKTPC